MRTSSVSSNVEATLAAFIVKSRLIDLYGLELISHGEGDGLQVH